MELKMQTTNAAGVCETQIRHAADYSGKKNQRYDETLRLPSVVMSEPESGSLQIELQQIAWIWSTGTDR
jgi:hypothetical protein